MDKPTSLWRACILEVLLALVSVAIIAGYCYGFDLLVAEWAKILLAGCLLVGEVMAMLVLNAFFSKPGESSPFMVLYMIAYIIFTGIICAYSILYLENAIAVVTCMLLFAIALFFLSLILVVFHRTTAIYRGFATDI